MSELLANCPRCGAMKTTFDLYGENYLGKESNWQKWFEIYSICRHCKKGTVFVVSQKSITSTFDSLYNFDGNINYIVQIEKYINIKENSTDKPPEYLPKDIDKIFQEGITCKSVECFNASATMFRLCLDKATKSLLPDEDRDGLNNKIRRSLGLRIQWLISNNILSSALEDLAQCIKDDGNDGAHEGILSKTDLDDIYDFTYILLERLFTEPKKIELAKERRKLRHTPKN